MTTDKSTKETTFLGKDEFDELFSMKGVIDSLENELDKVSNLNLLMLF